MDTFPDTALQRFLAKCNTPRRDRRLVGDRDLPTFWAECDNGGLMFSILGECGIDAVKVWNADDKAAWASFCEAAAPIEAAYREAIKPAWRTYAAVAIPLEEVYDASPPGPEREAAHKAAIAPFRLAYREACRPAEFARAAAIAPLVADAVRSIYPTPPAQVWAAVDAA